MLQKINHWQHYFLDYIYFWAMACSNILAPNVIYVVKWFNFYCSFGHNFCSEMSYQVPNHQNKINLVLIEKINYWLQSFLGYIEFWAMAHFGILALIWYTCSEIAYFFTDSVISCVLRWVIRYPTHQRNFCLVLIEKINDWLQSFLVYIEFWAMVKYCHYSPNVIYVVKLLIFSLIWS